MMMNLNGEARARALRQGGMMGVMPSPFRRNSPPPAFFQERLMARRQMIRDAEVAGALKAQRKGKKR